MPLPPDLAAQIAWMQRELRYRHKVYPRLVRARKMEAQQAAAQLRTMEAVLQTLTSLQPPPPEEVPDAPSRP